MTEKIRCGKFFEAVHTPTFGRADRYYWHCGRCETEGEEETLAAIHHLYKTAHASCRKSIS